MNANMLEWKHSITIPLYDKLHEVAYAYFRTSEWGQWDWDTDAPSEPLVVNLARGKSRMTDGFLGIGRTEWRKTSVNSQPHHVRMFLRITFRPSSSTVKIVLYHSAWGFSSSSMENQQSAFEHISRHVRQEVDGFCHYLAEFYELNEPPQICVLKQNEQET